MPKQVSLGNRILMLKGAGKSTGVAVCHPMSVTWTDVTDIPFDVSIDLDISDLADERLVVRRLEVSAREGGPPVTSAALRSLPFGKLRDAAVAAASTPITTGPDGEYVINSPIPGFHQREALDAEALRIATSRRETGPKAKLDDRHLAKVARLYRRATQERIPTRRAIQKEFTPAPSPSTVARWVQEARRRVDPATGQPFLGSATGTRAGEA